MKVEVLCSKPSNAGMPCPFASGPHSTTLNLTSPAKRGRFSSGSRVSLSLLCILHGHNVHPPPCFNVLIEEGNRSFQRKRNILNSGWVVICVVRSKLSEFEGLRLRDSQSGIKVTRRFRSHGKLWCSGGVQAQRIASLEACKTTGLSPKVPEFKADTPQGSLKCNVSHSRLLEQNAQYLAFEQVYLFT